MKIDLQTGKPVSAVNFMYAQDVAGFYLCVNDMLMNYKVYKYPILKVS